MNLKRIFISISILVFLNYGCKKEASEESQIPVGWQDEMSGKILATSSSNPIGLFWISENGITTQTDLGLSCNKPSGAGWSPDGSSIVYSCLQGIWICSIDGVVNQIIDSTKLSSDPTWSADGSMIAFSAGSNICVYSLETGMITKYSINHAFNNSLDWSSDGTKIVFCSIWTNFATSYVSIIDLNGTTNYGISQSSTYPAWSPDGKSIAFIMKDNDGVKQIHLSDADGNQKEQLTHSVLPVAGPISWSPDGKFIAARTMEGIYIYDLQGLPYSRFTTGSSVYCIDWGK